MLERQSAARQAFAEVYDALTNTVYEAVVDANVPPLPPHVTFEQATAMTRALVNGDPDRREIIRQTLRELAPQLSL